MEQRNQKIAHSSVGAPEQAERESHLAGGFSYNENNMICEIRKYGKLTKLLPAGAAEAVEKAGIR